MMRFFKYHLLFRTICYWLHVHKTFIMAAARGSRWPPLLYIAIVVAIAGPVVAKNVAQLSVTEIEDAIQVGIRSRGTRDRERPRAMS